ncbi:MAG TPA: serine/threonine-protein kinase, partial [Gemmatimonadaceae bacterium]|nr:serine/threonine-protein kinase [Gemmatimonadaceae bacterium]
WSWGPEGVVGEHRHYQEILDALGRSLSLVSAPDPAHARWLEAEARELAHRNHPAVPTTYHYWANFPTSRRGPGYLRRWIAGETAGARLRRMGADDIPGMLRLLRAAGATLAYLHDLGHTHGALSPEYVWQLPMGRLYVLGWQWALPSTVRPPGLVPDRRWMPAAPEWGDDGWAPTHLSDQWQLAALCFTVLTGEFPPPGDVPPLQLLRPDCPQAIAATLERALHQDPARRYPSIAAMLRDADRVTGSRSSMTLATESAPGLLDEPEEVRLRWALADDYEVLNKLGSGTFGSVWLVRDLSLGREVALKLLHPHVARDERAVSRFRREARLAAQLAHPAIVPIYDWDSRGDLAWYTMELAESGSVADLVRRSGPRPLDAVAPQVDFLLSGLGAAHAVGIVHRDLKPENILIDRYRRWRIADFGIANAPGEDVAGASGTPAFAAPEQLLGEQQDASADCFSVAAIVAYVLTGTAPFGEKDVKVILTRQLAGQLDVTPYPEPLADWLRRALSPEPDSRFEDATLMQRAWRDAMSAIAEVDRRLPWWRRWSGGIELPPGWSTGGR